MNAIHEPTHQHQQYDDEIDLWELVTCLWRGKLWILLSAGLFAIAGLAYATLATESWRAEAQISQPRYADYQPLVAQMQNLRPAFGNSYDQQLINLGIESPEAVYHRFTSLYNAADNRRAFLRQHPVFIEALEQTADTLEEADTNGPSRERRALNRWSQRFSYSASDEGASATLAVEAQNPAASARLLSDFVSYTNAQLLDEWEAGVQSLIRTQRQSLEQSRAELQSATRDDLTNEVQRLNHALTIARAADVMNPLVDPGTQDDFAINLGAPAIEAKIKALQSIEDLSVLEPRLTRVGASLRALNEAELTKPEAFKAYQYRMTPSTPTDRESPRTLLILVASLFMGGVLGSLGVLITQAVRNRREKPSFHYLTNPQSPLP